MTINVMSSLASDVLLGNIAGYMTATYIAHYCNVNGNKKMLAQLAGAGLLNCALVATCPPIERSLHMWLGGLCACIIAPGIFVMWDKTLFGNHETIINVIELPTETKNNNSNSD